MEIPLNKWEQCLATWLNDVRRYNGIGNEELNEYEDATYAGKLRKLLTLTGRDL